MKRINQDNMNLMHKHANRADALEREKDAEDERKRYDNLVDM